MNIHQQWLEANKQYLQDYIRWVQLRLERHIAAISPPPAPPAPVKVRKSSWFGLFYTEELVTTNPSEPEQDLTAIDADLEELEQVLAKAETAEPPPALIILSRQLGLSRFERDILLACAALELDGKTAALCAKAQPGTGKPYPTFALALQLFDQSDSALLLPDKTYLSAWDALSAHRPLRYWHLLEINQPGAEPLVTSALRADERIVNYLVKPQPVLDDRLRIFVIPTPALDQQELLLSASQSELAENLSQYLERQQVKTSVPERITIQLTGPDSTTKLTLAQHALAKLGLEPIRIALENLPAQAGELEYLLRLWGRERLLLPVALYIDLQSTNETHNHNLQRILSSTKGIVIIANRDPLVDSDGLILEVSKPLTKEQQIAWEVELRNRELASQLAGQFSLDIPSIQQISAGLEDENQDAESLRNQVWRACLIKTSPQLDQLAQRLDVKANWSHLVLPPEPLSLLQQITAQVEHRMRVYSDWGFDEKMNRGMGLSVLFAGESGTGKTMAAEVIANSLQLNLYRIDLSSVVSKYIGETEKNLRKLFDAAENGGAILFFDEADALFGKRSEVKDSHDRYANIEINYLLQRIEAYRGLAILATNMKSSLDSAFMRRLRFIVNFQFPAAAQRAEIWRRVFPAQTPQNELDYQHLARFNLTGGSIHNIALNAAFLAAGSEAGKVTMPLIFDAIRAEFRKLDKPVNEAEFRLLGVAGAAV